jgi:hypothetical protein
MPFCPKCRNEFQAWVKTCPDCGEKLVATLSPKSESKKDIALEDEIMVLNSYDRDHAMDAWALSRRLQSEGIWSFVAEDRFIPGPIRLLVKRADAEIAKEILEAPVEQPTDEEIEESANRPPGDDGAVV